jgi:spermidine synthase
MMVGAAFALIASGLFSNNRNWLIGASIIAAFLIAVPFAKSPEYYDFVEHLSKRGVKEHREKGKVEATVWDPISKIDIVNDQQEDTTKHVAYDGGQQSSRLYRFDGDIAKLRNKLDAGDENVNDHFWFAGVLASHYLKRDTNQDVLIIGSAGGQETKAALVYGARSVDAVELVGAVVDFVVNKYSSYIGGIFRDPRVNVISGEGRSFIRSQHKKYDIIQIFSNHTSSSVASGTGAVATTYLQTADAYKEYLEHLKPAGILHINHHFYVKMVTTAALAWKQMGRENFRKHVVVFHRNKPADTLPTMMIKMSPWTEAEINALKPFLAGGEIERFNSYIVEDPIHPENSFLSDDFYSKELPKKLISDMPYRIVPSTDDRPYFNFTRKSFGHFQENPKIFLDRRSAELLNKRTIKTIPMDIIHLIVTGATSLFFCILFIFVPLYFSKAGRSNWPERKYTLTYFSCLGAGFIIIELVFIQIFMKLIGYPLYTYSIVVFTLLLAAGIGSLSSNYLRFDNKARWKIPFIAILLTGFIFTLSYTTIFNHFLKYELPTRLLVSFVLIFPVGFFLGMPFPLGILSISDKPSGAIAWAWAMNGLFTVIGGIASIVFSIYWGFQATLILALLIYLLAIFMYYKQNHKFRALDS